MRATPDPHVFEFFDFYFFFMALLPFLVFICFYGYYVQSSKLYSSGTQHPILILHPFLAFLSETVPEVVQQLYMQPFINTN